MTFIDRKTSRKAQEVRKGRGKFETPDRPDTYLAYSLTGQSETRHETALGAALKGAGVETATERRPRRKGPANRRRKATAPKPEQRRANPAAAMRKVAQASKPE